MGDRRCTPRAGLNIQVSGKKNWFAGIAVGTTTGNVAWIFASGQNVFMRRETMKCPYRSVVHQTNVDSYLYNDFSQNKAHFHSLDEIQEFADCYGEECAMWQDGKCSKTD